MKPIAPTCLVDELRRVAERAHVEHRVDARDVLPQHGRDRRVAVEVPLRPDHRLARPELQRLGLAHHKVTDLSDREDALVDVRVVPHERRLEVVVIAVAVHRLQRRHLEQEAGQGVQ